MKHILTCSFGKDSIATALEYLSMCADTLDFYAEHGEPLDELVYSEVMFSDTDRGNCRSISGSSTKQPSRILKSEAFLQGSCAGKRHIWTAFTAS